MLSPANGTLVKVFNTHHAFCLETDGGAEVVVHIDIDTVALNGQGFTCLVEEGSKVTQGQPILELDLAYLNANARSMISPVVVSNMEEFGALTRHRQYHGGGRSKSALGPHRQVIATVCGRRYQQSFAHAPVLPLGPPGVFRSVFPSPRAMP